VKNLEKTQENPEIFKLQKNIIKKTKKRKKKQDKKF
jgi:hypothetical protein